VTNLKPWSLAWVGTAAFLALAVFMGGIALFMLTQLSRMSLPVGGKISLAALCLSQLGFLASTFMWRWYWRDVQWDTQFLDFIRGPEPEYEDARDAWHWGRRARAFWLAGVASLVVTVAYIL
jgi:hypothetical protein